MSTASISSMGDGARGATALGPGPGHRHFLGNALRAVRVFVGAVFSVVVLGRPE